MGKRVTFIYQGVEYTGKIHSHDPTTGTDVIILSPEASRNEVMNFPPGALEQLTTENAERGLLGGVQDMTSGVDFTKHLEAKSDKNVNENKIQVILDLLRFVRVQASQRPPHAACDPRL